MREVRPVRLYELLVAVDVVEVHGDRTTTVSSITHDSHAVRPGSLYCCVRGARADGHDFAPAAVAAGATALLAERRLDLPVPQVIVADSRAAMAPVSAAVFGRPSEYLDVVGVTGTNGKTTTTHLVAAILEADGRPTGVLGTLSGARTTLEAPELQSALAGFRDEGCRAVAMEVSSHALVRHRVDAVRFAVGAFTNLSRDHLDEHGTMEAYFEAKARLFEPSRCRAAVVCVDDRWGARLARQVQVPLRVCSLDEAVDLEVGPLHSTFVLRGRRVRLGLGGRHNARNAVVAAAAADVLGVDAATVADGLRRARAVPGRFEPVAAGQPFVVLVDYSHTPDALQAALLACREVTGPDHRLLVVFGCGGDRDRGKRPEMGAIATDLADVAVLTTDNPRHEDPMAIIEEVRAGVRRPERLVVEPDRAAAIAVALDRAEPGDVVLIAGKGHETYQEGPDGHRPFDDRDVARARLRGVYG